MGQPTYYLDATAIAARTPEVPDADWVNGVNNGGSNAPGIGVNMLGGAVDGSPSQFTLLDQDGDIRVPQVSQQIGGLALDSDPDDALSGGVEGKGTQPILTGTLPTNTAKENADNDPSIDGTVIANGTANLQTLGAGWVATAV